MPKRVTLVALWAVFAVASVSVGFAAASLVSDPFTDVRSAADVTGPGGSGDAPFSESTPSPDNVSAPTASPSATSGHTSTPTPTGSATHSSSPTTSPPTASPAASVRGGIPTRGGYVSGTCRSGLVSVGAAPAVWWDVDSYTHGWVHTARVRLEPSEDANGERVEVTVSCSPGGKPAFAPTYHPGGGGGGGDDGGGSGGGGDDSGGSGGGGDSGGSDDSSGSGDG